MNESEFQELKEWWVDDTAYLSSPIQKAMHPAYQRIIGGGKESLPFIIEDLKEGPDHWFWALKSITGADPIPKEHEGRMELMAEDWIKWYEENVG